MRKILPLLLVLIAGCQTTQYGVQAEPECCRRNKHFEMQSQEGRFEKVGQYVRKHIYGVIKNISPHELNDVCIDLEIFDHLDRVIAVKRTYVAKSMLSMQNAEYNLVKETDTLNTPDHWGLKAYNGSTCWGADRV